MLRILDKADEVDRQELEVEAEAEAEVEAPLHVQEILVVEVAGRPRWLSVQFALVEDMEMVEP